MFDIAIILINYNSGALTISCVKSIIEKTSAHINYQIIITDNCSQIDDYLTLKKECETLNLSNLLLVRSRLNTGYGGGNMMGVNYANAKYLAFVNNDTLFKNDCLNILKTAIENNSSIGIAGAQAYSKDNGFMISLDHFASPAREIFGRNILEKINPTRHPNRKKTYSQPLKVEFIPGSFMFVKATDFNAVGGFDTNIFLYYEETDLCKRLKAIGKDAWLIPSAKFIHYHGASTPKSTAIKKELKISLLYIMRKHYGILGHVSVWLFLFIKYFFSSIFKSKNRSLFLLILKGAPISASLKQKQVVTEF